MLAHEPDGITIGVPGSQAFRNPSANATASSRRPSLNGACPQQKVLCKGTTFSFKSTRIFVVASIAAGKNSSARQVAKSFTSVISISATRGSAPHLHPTRPPRRKDPSDRERPAQSSFRYRRYG